MDEIRIIAENLSDANGLWKDSRVLRRAQLSDLAEQIHRRLEEDEEGEQTLASLYREFEEQQALQELAGEGTAAHSLTLYTRIELCKALTRLRGAEAVPLYDFPDPVIAYFQNPYAGRILQAVVELLEGGEATDAEDYADACEGVVEGRYDFCLLPVESARDGVMNRFVQLIDQYGLFTVLLCHLEIGEEEYIRFALLSASPCEIGNADRLQLRVVPGKERLWELLFAGEALGAKLCDCRLLQGGEEAAYQLTFSVENADLTALQHYLELGGSRSTVTGYYKQITLPLEGRQELLYS